VNKTLLIILAVALLVGGAAAWFLLSRAPDGATEPVAIGPEVPEVVAVQPAPAEPETESETPEPVQTESAVLPEPAPVWAPDGTIRPGEYAHSTSLIDVTIHWFNDANVLRVGLESPANGYVSIGFDPEDRMEGANYIVAYVEEGEVYIRDDFGIGPTSHAADTDRGGTDNILSYGGTEWADHTVVEFSIPLDSGDAQDKALRPGWTYDILVAYHDLLDGFSGRHSRRGSGQITLDHAP